MRCVARVLLLAVVFPVAGCNHFSEPNPVIARITSITAPDTVTAGAEFEVLVHAVLGYHIGYVLDDTAVARSSTLLDMTVWTRDEWKGDYYLPATSDIDLSFEAGPAEPGKFRIIAHQPDGKDTLKTITVLP